MPVAWRACCLQRTRAGSAGRTQASRTSAASSAAVAPPRRAREMEEHVAAVALLPARATKTVFFVRHGEGYHNVAGAIDNELYKSEKYADAHLTPLGWQQAEALKAHIAAQARPLTQTLELVVVSPLTRAVETAVGAFGGAVAAAPSAAGEPLLMTPHEAAEGVRPSRPAVSAAGAPPFVACELCREHLGVHPCDRRRELSFYKARFPGVDWSGIESEQDALWQADVRESDAHLAQRAAAFLRWLMARPEQHIAVVTHSSWLSVMFSVFTGDCSVAAGTNLKRWFNNAELRTVVLHDRSGEEWGWGAVNSDFIGGDEGMATAAAIAPPAAMEN